MKDTHWQLIETAPKDGTWILVWGHKVVDADKEPIGLARWVKSSWDSWQDDGPRKRVLVTTDDSGWECDDHLYDPTHWMRLPSPPGSQE
jgi:hypothetical protein